MKIGTLKKRVTLQYPSMALDNMGGTDQTWTDSETIFAAIWPVSAKDRVSAAALTMEITHRIRIRYKSNIKSNWRVKYGERYFAIIGIINPNESNRMLELLCRETA